jgi:hypothetical protein
MMEYGTVRTSETLPDKSVFGDLVIEINRKAPGLLRLDWRGKSNHSNPEAVLSAFFSNVTRLAVQSRARIEMHFEELEFFNSSTITAIIKYIRELRQRQIALAVSFSANHKWQRIFFDALWIFVKEDGLFTITAVK